MRPSPTILLGVSILLVVLGLIFLALPRYVTCLGPCPVGLSPTNTLGLLIVSGGFVGATFLGAKKLWGHTAR